MRKFSWAPAALSTMEIVTGTGQGGLVGKGGSPAGSFMLYIHWRTLRKLLVEPALKLPLSTDNHFLPAECSLSSTSSWPGHLCLCLSVNSTWLFGVYLHAWCHLRLSLWPFALSVDIMLLSLVHPIGGPTGL